MSAELVSHKWQKLVHDLPSGVHTASPTPVLTCNNCTRIRRVPLEGPSAHALDAAHADVQLVHGHTGRVRDGNDEVRAAAILTVPPRIIAVIETPDVAVGAVDPRKRRVVTDTVQFESGCGSEVSCRIFFFIFVADLELTLVCRYSCQRIM
jgi:hypothetical protein